MTDESIFASALEKPDPAERAAYLVSACAGDPEQRARVEALLAAHVRAGDFLEGPADGSAPGLGATWRRGDPPPEEAEESLDFLEPPIRADSLGRLGHYEVLQVVGRGGFGIVFRAFDDVLQRVVAIKVMSPRMAETSPARKRFVREARGYAAVRHENVVQVYAIEGDSLPYLVMEFVPGGTLEGMLGKTGPLDAVDVVRIGVQLARGLAAAHAIGLIHRDVKPANILIERGPELRVKITDFGLARAADDASLTQSGMIAGTPMYMAPEQAHGVTLDHRADLFSLGSVLYEMCTGRTPFRAPTTLAVLKRVVEDDPRPIRDVIPETPQRLCEVIEKLHAKNPDGRFQSATEVADALSRCLSDETVLPNPIKPVLVAADPPSEPAPKAQTARAEPARQARPIPWLAFAVLGGLLLLGGVAFAMYALPAKKPASDPQAGLPPLPPPLPLPPFPPLPSLPPTLKNSIGMEFVKVPKGKSWLGGGKDKLGDKEVEFKDDFYLGKYEVTQEEWEKVTGLTPSMFNRANQAVKYIGDADLKRFPVEQMSWDDCQAFVKNVNEREKESGWVYRLPTASEWEYACRGGPVGKPDSAFDFYFGKPTNTLSGQANFHNILRRTCKVGSYEPNSLGLHDMHGNVWEWCGDARTTDDGASHRVVRGGGWKNDSGACRAEFWSSDPPSNRHNALGLRLARVPLAPGDK